MNIMSPDDYGTYVESIRKNKIESILIYAVTCIGNKYKKLRDKPNNMDDFYKYIQRNIREHIDSMLQGKDIDFIFPLSRTLTLESVPERHTFIMSIIIYDRFMKKEFKTYVEFDWAR